MYGGCSSAMDGLSRPWSGGRRRAVLRGRLSGSTRLVSGAGRASAGVRGSGVVGRSAGGAGRYGSCCSVRVGIGTGAAGEMTGWAGVGIGAEGGTQRAILGGSTAGSRGGGGAVILGGSTTGSRGGGGGALRAGWGFSGATCRTARGAAGCDGTTACLDGVGSRSTMARRPTAAGSVVVGFLSSKSQLNGSAGVARRGRGGSERSRPGCLWLRSDRTWLKWSSGARRDAPQRGLRYQLE